MITLEGYKIEEMRSINHIMTVELQFDKPVTQKEARDYLSRVLAKANELEMQAEKEICKKIFNADEIVITKEPKPEGTIFCAAPENILEYLAESDKRLNELNFNFPQEEETANESLKIEDENVINEENLAVKKKQIANAFGVPETVLEDIGGTWPPAADVKKPEKIEGVLKVPVTDEEIAGMMQKKLAEEAKAEKPKKIDWDKACALKKADWSNKQIAEELHANEGTIGAMIYKHLEKYNAGERKVKYEEKAEV